MTHQITLEFIGYMSAATLNEASDFSFCTSPPILADGMEEALPETGLRRRIPIIPRPWRADVGSEVFVMGGVTHDVFLECGKRIRPGAKGAEL